MSERDAAEQADREEEEILPVDMDLEVKKSTLEKVYNDFKDLEYCYLPCVQANYIRLKWKQIDYFYGIMHFP